MGSEAATQVGLLPVYGEEFSALPAETEKNEVIRARIVNAYETPEDYLADTRYFYNYVDLDAGGTDKVLRL